MKKKVYKLIAGLVLAGLFAMTGCSAQESTESAAESQVVEAESEAAESEAAESEAAETEAVETEAAEAEAAETETAESEAAGTETAEASITDLQGESLMIYCGAGMQKPFQDIADAFQNDTGCEMNVTFANAAQIQTQISEAQEGAFFIAGSAEEVKPVEEYVLESKSLVKHIPVLAVAEGNPKGISGVADLGNEEIVTVIGDPESTPIGKIAMKAFKDFGIEGAVNLASTTTTAPQLATLISMGEADAAIIWKENCNAEGVMVLETSDMDDYIKVIPAARLSFSEGNVAADEFAAYLDTAAAQDIWKSYGYELVE